LAELARFGIKPGLERTRALLRELGNPEKELNCIHVAGTNGKGSVSFIIASVLSAAGYKTGRFSSPHIHSYRERFTIDGQDIEEQELERYLKCMQNIIKKLTAGGEGQPTEFEVLTALAFKYFSNNQVNPAVLEVGLGGTYDATNVIVPLVSVITSIDYDHQAVLGNSLQEIAANKAGIIKKGIPVVTGLIPPDALSVIREKVIAEKTELVTSDRVKINRKSASILSGQIIDIQYGLNYLPEVKFGLSGDFQLENLRTALNTLLVLDEYGYHVSKQDLIMALQSLKFPGRMEVVSEQPLVIIDAAHNPHGAKALADSLAASFSGRKKFLLCGYLDDKDAETIIDYLGPDTSCCVVSRPEGQRAANWKRVADIWKRKYPGIKCIVEENIDDAVELGLELLNTADYMVITGSFYLIDRARKHFTKS
jgi:dihydrofolate synthase/folylpolyglutamate synthase